VILAGGMALVASPGGADAVSSAEGGLAGGTGLVTIVTDSAGIPHITASNFTALGYGEAYAFAEDNFCTLAEDFVTVNGERSKYFGPNGIVVNYASDTDSTNLQSDMFWKSVKDSGLFKRETSAPPPIGPLPQVRQLYQGFVDGYNAYLASGRLHDPTCAGQPWVRPITLEDLFLRMVQIVTTPSSGSLIPDEAAAAPPAPQSTASPDTAYTLDDANYGDEWRAVNEYLQMGQATSVQGLLDVQEKDLADPSFNTMAADDHGNALYADVENVPNVSSQLISECLPSGLATAVYQESGLITLDGSTTACAWQDDRGTPVPGIFDSSQEPHTIRTDYVENSNDSYWLANPSAPFPAYSPIIGDIDVPQGLRTRLGNEMIAERVAGTDGLGSPKFSIPTMQAMWENDRSLLAELVLPQLVSACEQAPVQTSDNGTTVNLTAACAALAGYEKYENGDLDASGGWLFTLWYYFLNSGQFWSVPFNAAEPLTTPSGLDTANPDTLRALADAALNMQANHLPLDAPFGQVQHATRGTDIIPIHGCDTGCFNAIDTTLIPGDPLTPGDYGEVVHGSSLVITAELSPSGPMAQGILTYSQATNPLSPPVREHDQAVLGEAVGEARLHPGQLAAEPGNQSVVMRS
jgi:acyl-homoserine lactone acylase PvdQ